MILNISDIQNAIAGKAAGLVQFPARDCFGD